MNVLRLPEWPSLGRGAVDFVAAGWPGPARHFGELKWCQAGDDKVYEAIWDLFKMALASRLPGIRTAHLITGAPSVMWSRGFCADLFDGGTFTVEELCAPRFPRGRRRVAWDYLLEGGYDRFPIRVPAHPDNHSRWRTRHGRRPWPGLGAPRDCRQLHRRLAGRVVRGGVAARVAAGRRASPAVARVTSGGYTCEAESGPGPP